MIVRVHLHNLCQIQKTMNIYLSDFDLKQYATTRPNRGFYFSAFNNDIMNPLNNDKIKNIWQD